LFIVLVDILCLKIYGDNHAENVPPKYIVDTVIPKTRDGSAFNDTVWHTVQNIKLLNQLGDTVNLHDIKDRAIVADFFFTSCGSICPTLTRNMRGLQQYFEQKNKSNIVQFLSFTIDPERDTVAKLKQYSESYGAESKNWWFLTGNRDSIYNFIFQQMKVDKYDDSTPINPGFAHTSYFVLLDKNFHIRGYYEGLDTLKSLSQLTRDITALADEDKKYSGFSRLGLMQMGIIFVGAILLILLWILFFKAEKLKS
jgi:protein SCO1/2